MAAAPHVAVGGGGAVLAALLVGLVVGTLLGSLTGGGMVAVRAGRGESLREAPIAATLHAA